MASLGFDMESPMFKRNRKSDSSDNLEEYLLHKHIEKLISKPLVYEYLSATDVDEDAMRIEYKKFLHFIDKYPEPGRTQLTGLVFPVFVHFYLLLIRNSELSETKTQGFYDLYSKLFVNDDGYKDKVKELHELKTIEDFRNHVYFHKFCEMKYIFNVSSDVLLSLKSFLERCKCSLLSNILRFHFHFEALDADLEVFNLADINCFKHKSVSDKERDSQKDINPFNEYISKAYIRKIEFQCPLSCSSLDVNNDETQICVANSCPFILVANLEKKKNSEHHKQNTFEKSKEQIIFDDNNCLANFSEHVNAVKYIPGILDQVLVASGTEVKLLNSITGEVLSSFQSKHTNVIMDIDINSSAVFFATASKDMTVCLYNFHKNEAIKKYMEHMDCVNVVRFHPNGIYFATGASDTTVRLYELGNNYSIRSFDGHKSAVYQIAFSPDGKMLASSDLHGFIRIWNIADNFLIGETSCYETFDVNLGKVSSLCFNHNSSELAASNLKGILRLYNVYAKENAVKIYATEYFQNTPLLIKCNKNGNWTVVSKKNIQ